MRKSTLIASIIPILFIIEFVGVRIMGASEIIKIVSLVFIIGLLIGQMIGRKHYMAILEEDDNHAIDDNKYFNILRVIIVLAVIWVVIESLWR